MPNWDRDGDLTPPEVSGGCASLAAFVGIILGGAVVLVALWALGQWWLR